jgi:hypothetical protein
MRNEWKRLRATGSSLQARRGVTPRHRDSVTNLKPEA